MGTPIRRILFFAALAGLATGNLACDNPEAPHPVHASGPFTWVPVESFQSGGILSSIAVTGPGEFFCARQGLDRRSDGWTVYPDGEVVHFNGEWNAPVREFHAATYPVGVWASSPTDVYLADGTLHHFDGVAWSDLPVPVNLIFGTGATDIYAAHSRGERPVYHYDGKNWSLLTTFGEAADPNDDEIVSLWAMSGPFLAVLRTHGISTWDGASWSYTAFQVWDYVYDVWGTSPANLYAVGNPYSPDGEVLHFNGTTWDYSALPEDTPALRAIWGSSSYDVYAVGDRGGMVHFNGVWWDRVAPVTYKALRDIWGSGPGDIFVLGDDGKALHFDGVKWTSFGKNSPDAHVRSFCAESATRFAVANWLDHGTVYLYDNSVWTESYVGSDGNVSMVAGPTLDNLWVEVGEASYHFDGSIWYPVPAPADFAPVAMWFPDGPGNGFAASGNGVLKGDLYGWHPSLDTTPWPAVGVWGVPSGSPVFAISEQLVYRYDGVSWANFPAPDGKLIDIEGVSEDEVYVLTIDHGVLGLSRLEGTTWHRVPAPRFGQKLVVTAPDNMLTLAGCWVSRFDGRTWVESCSPDDYPLQVIETTDGAVLKLTTREVSRQVIGIFPE